MPNFLNSISTCIKLKFNGGQFHKEMFGYFKKMKKSEYSWTRLNILHFVKFGVENVEHLCCVEKFVSCTKKLGYGMDGWMDGTASLRIAYSNQKRKKNIKFFWRSLRKSQGKIINTNPWQMMKNLKDSTVKIKHKTSLLCIFENASIQTTYSDALGH